MDSFKVLRDSFPSCGRFGINAFNSTIAAGLGVLGFGQFWQQTGLH